MRLSRSLTAALLALGALVLPLAAAAETWPARPVRWIVPFAAGGPADILARVIGERLTEALGQQVFVDNRGGASGNIGTEAAVKAPPDGYTILSGIASTITTNQFLMKMSFDPAKDLQPVSLVTRGAFLLLVREDSPARTLADFVALAKARPDKLTYGSWGNGSGTHLAMELFRRRTGIDVIQVPYKGSAPVLTDLMGGQLDTAFETANPALQHVRAGKLRVIATSGETRHPALPEVPTIGETWPDFSVLTWGGVFVPLGTPREIVDRLSRELARIVRDPAMSTKLAALGSEPVGSTPEEFATRIAADVALWGKIITEAGIKAD